MLKQLCVARDKFHDIVKNALEKDGWDITHDPLRIDIGDRTIHIDLGAQRLIGAQKGNEKIAVEIKSFLGLSPLNDFYNALGQFNFYLLALEKEDSQRVLFLAVPHTTYKSFFKESITKEAVKRYNIKILVYHIQEEMIVKWIK